LKALLMTPRPERSPEAFSEFAMPLGEEAQ
jgi:hypothetical protein